MGRRGGRVQIALRRWVGHKQLKKIRVGSGDLEERRKIEGRREARRGGEK